MLTKKRIVEMHTQGNVVDLRGVRQDIPYADDYRSEPEPTAATRRFKTDRERVREIQQCTDYKDLRG